MQNEKIARNRAQMPEGTTSIIGRRSLQRSHQRLTDFLQTGISVLDIGCGTGAITADITQTVAPGEVVGIDENKQFIDSAAKKHAELSNLSFAAKDIYQLDYHNQFDVVTASRVLQWLTSPEKALNKLIQATKTDGCIVVLDYNHEKIKWSPDPPESMQYFYKAFLKWRSDAGMDNRIADHLADMFSANGLTNIETSVQHETVTKSDHDFKQRVSIWAEVADSRGHQLVADGYITETERAGAVEEYRDWINTSAESMEMYLLAVSGCKK
ncbi:methyltransferase domain-containing protein [Gracilibacillus oryzae]|uniref:Methyltransferase domain-containing protein n=1 Tax=Gracilibacillus oryzae TaxID=1672701 RepID=A0A7C8GUA8_9BACI|nr:methyltransferase domain-containing protein [Gracilibacillus oryzae]KAB8138159.1 methyltransferase domain-containing protein [Gracilibacillus oryzae]